MQVDILDGNVTRDNYGVLVIQSPGTPPEDHNDEVHGFSNPNYNVAYGCKCKHGKEMFIFNIFLAHSTSTLQKKNKQKTRIP